MGKHEVYMFLKGNKRRKGFTTREISELSGMSLGSVTNAVKKLRDDGSIIVASVKKAKPGRVNRYKLNKDEIKN